MGPKEETGMDALVNQRLGGNKRLPGREKGLNLASEGHHGN